MRLPPWLARVQYRSITLWLPLVLLWPLALLVLVPLLLVGVAASQIVDGLSFPEFRRLCGGVFRLLCELPGTSVSVDVPQGRIAFTLY
jgi:hypothetical protein